MQYFHIEEIRELKAILSLEKPHQMFSQTRAVFLPADKLNLDLFKRYNPKKDFLTTNQSAGPGSHGILSALNRTLKSIFEKKHKLKTNLKKEYDGAFKDVADFINHCKSNSVKIYLYTLQPVSNDEQLKVNSLIESGIISAFNALKKPSDLVPILKSERISMRNSLLVVSNYAEKSEAAMLPLAEYNGVIEWNNWESISELKDKIEYYLKGKAHPFLSNQVILFVEDTWDKALNNYLLKNLDAINKRLEEKGLTLVYFPAFISKHTQQTEFLLDFVRYRNPVLYSLKDSELQDAVVTILRTFTTQEFYSMILNELELPYFRKPALLRNISVEQGALQSRFTYKHIEHKSKSDLKRFFKWYIEQVRVPNDSQHIFFSLAKPPEDYDADWHFGTEAKQLSEELKKKIDAFKDDGKYGALVDAIMYMLETIKDEKPEIIDKVRPLLEKRKLLESKVVLSPIVIDKHYNIFLPAFGNQEVKMHALPKTVYLLFLRYPKGIRFKELYQYKTELLEIYNKVTNKYEKEEIERAIDDLVDMTKPSINQKCARIREAFRTIMDEHIAKHYYIDGINGEPKSIALSPDLITIQK